MSTLWADRTGRPRAVLVMGVCNVTPDSFFDGGRYFDHDRAIAHGQDLVAEGADVVDVGGESSRPYSSTVPEAEELRRVLPVVEALAPIVRVSIDTRKAAVAVEAVHSGATLINDITASGDLAQVAASHGVGWVAMHMRGTPADMQLSPRYDDVVEEVRDYLEERAALGLELGVPEIWVDPGIGFGKTALHNLELLAHLDKMAPAGSSLLVGTSRKSFLGRVAPLRDGTPSPPSERMETSVAMAVWSVHQGASMVRVHDVEATVQALRIGSSVPSGAAVQAAPSGLAGGR